MQYDYLMPDADNALRERCIGAAHAVYGNVLPTVVKERLFLELNAIETGHFASRYLIAAEISDQSKRMGYPVTTRGTLGSAFVSRLCGFSAVNPLPAHYLCVKCRHFEMADACADERKHGFDLPKKICPHCGAEMRSDGAGILPEILMGKSFSREPAVILNCAPRIRKHLVDHLMNHLDARVIRAGVARRGADGELKKGVHPGGIYIVPKEADISMITAVRESDPDDAFRLPIAVRDYSELQNVLTRYDLLPLPALEWLGDPEQSAGRKTADIPMNDNTLLEACYRFESDVLLSNPKTRAWAKTAAALAKPRCFSDVVALYGLLYGEGTWNNNAEELLRKGIPLCDVIAYRDDVLQCLERYGADRESSLRIMNRIKDGKGLTEADEQRMRRLGIPAWFTDSCKKIGYLFPRSQGVEYAIMNLKLAYCKLNCPDMYDKLSS